jgi:hypothetical protein
VGRRPIPKGPTYEVEVKAGAGAIAGSVDLLAGDPVELILCGVCRALLQAVPAPVSGPT